MVQALFGRVALLACRLGRQVMAMNKERGNRDGTSRSTGMETFKVLLWANMDSEKAFYRENCDISTWISTFSTRQQALWCPPRSLLLCARTMWWPPHGLLLLARSSWGAGHHISCCWPHKACCYSHKARCRPRKAIFCLNRSRRSPVRQGGSLDITQDHGRQKLF